MLQVRTEKDPQSINRRRPFSKLVENFPFYKDLAHYHLPLITKIF